MTMKKKMKCQVEGMKELYNQEKEIFREDGIRRLWADDEETNLKTKKRDKRDRD